jgi:hypothetical protein
MKKILSFDIGIKNLAFCAINYLPIQKTEKKDNIKQNIVKNSDIKFLEIINVTNFLPENLKTKNANKLPLFYLSKAVINALDTILSPVLQIFAPDIILIENQPVLKNPKMKTVQILIFGYLIQKYIDNPDINIVMFNARDKLQIYTGPPVECNLKSKYSRRKKLSILYTQWIFENNNIENSIITKFRNSKKKDDLADCYLQAVTYVFKKLV